MFEDQIASLRAQLDQEQSELDAVQATIDAHRDRVKRLRTAITALTGKKPQPKAIPKSASSKTYNTPKKVPQAAVEEIIGILRKAEAPMTGYAIGNVATTFDKHQGTRYLRWMRSQELVRVAGRGKTGGDAYLLMDDQT